MLLLAAITLSLNLEQVYNRPQIAQTGTPSSATCGIKTVAYRFVGEPGTEFRYAGDTYRVPVRGEIELIAEKGVTEYTVSSRKLALDVWPRDDFGMRTIPLPKQGAITDDVQGGAR
jgi:hypothetical protein